MTVIQTGVWTGVGDAVVIVAGTVGVAVVTTDVGEFNASVVEIGAVDWEQAVRTTAKVTAASVEVLTQSVYLAAVGGLFGRWVVGRVEALQFDD